MGDLNVFVAHLGHTKLPMYVHWKNWWTFMVGLSSNGRWKMYSVDRMTFVKIVRSRPMNVRQICYLTICCHHTKHKTDAIPWNKEIFTITYILYRNKIHKQYENLKYRLCRVTISQVALVRFDHIGIYIICVYYTCVMVSHIISFSAFGLCLLYLNEIHSILLYVSLRSICLNISFLSSHLFSLTSHLFFECLFDPLD